MNQPRVSRSPPVGTAVGRCTVLAGRSALLAVLLGIAGFAPVAAEDLATAAAQQVGVTTGYDGSYRRLAYPGGDVPIESGVCTDVLIRAYRLLGIDLQVRVHEDMRRAFSAYPPLWGLSAPDRNIDHRRVPNLETWFRRHGLVKAGGRDPADYQAGDIVSWRLDSGRPHIGIVSANRIDGRPLVLHNIGAGVREEDVLFDWSIVGHFRYPGE
jgi:uncharacterized protein YijF (DUF1287 family)